MRYGVALAIIGAFAVLGCNEGSTDREATVGAVSLPQAGAGRFEQVRNFGENPGGLNMYAYAPPNAPANAPLMVAMHACTQNGPTYRAAGWEPIADRFGFYVIYPEQTGANNGAGCFNWAGEYGDPTNLRRGEGENLSIISMIRHMQANYDIDADRIFASGHSGGAAQAALMLATWPDVFAGGAMIAGIPYNCTTQFAEVSGCLNPGRPRDAQLWAQYVFDAFPGFAGTYPKVSVWQGTADFTVAPVNGTEMVKQWATVHGFGLEADAVQQVGAHQRSVWFDGRGEAMVEYYVVNGGGHGTFVDPDQGCGSGGAFFVDNNICSSLRIAEFFGLTGDAPAPEPEPEPQEPEPQPEPEPQEPEPNPEPEPAGGLAIEIVSPADGAVLNGVVPVEAEVSEPGAWVTFAVNDIVIGVAFGAPYVANYNAFLEGQKTITATANTADGRQAVDSIRVCVGANCPPPPEPEPEPEPQEPEPQEPEPGELPDGEWLGCSTAPGGPSTPVTLLLLGLIGLSGLTRLRRRDPR